MTTGMVLGALSTTLAFLFAVSVLIVIHEYGHYRVAVACGVKVLRFSLGFGPVLWRYQRNPHGTEFVISALPLGGYVMMLDEANAPVAPEDLGRAFNRKPLWQRAAVVVAGPLANLLLAVMLYASLHWVGIEEPKARLGAPAAASLAERAGMRSGDQVQAVSFDGDQWDDVRSATDLRWHLTQAVMKQVPLRLRITDVGGHSPREVVLPLQTLGDGGVDPRTWSQIGLGSPYSEARLGLVKPDGAANRAGLREGDRVLSVDGNVVDDSGHLVALIRAHADKPQPMAWLVERAGQRISLSVSPATVKDGERRVGRIDAVPGQPPEMVTVQYGFADGLGRAVSRTWEISAMSLQMLGRMLIGQASWRDHLSGPLTIADYAGQSARLGASYYLAFLAVLSISIGVLNLLPLPRLDGGHLMYYLFEAVTGKPVSTKWFERLQSVGLAILLAMMSLALFNDVVRQIGQP
jgi:regulator of sigma E protease